MSDLKTAILDARYIDLIDLAGALVAEAGNPADTAEELAGPKQQAMAAAIFRWAATQYEGESET